MKALRWMDQAKAHPSGNVVVLPLIRTLHAARAPPPFFPFGVFCMLVPFRSINVCTCTDTLLGIVSVESGQI